MKKIRHLLFFVGMLCFLFSAKAQLPYEKLGEMIQTNTLSLENPIYKIPCGTKNHYTYLVSAITSGESLEKPLSYFSTEKPLENYINFSRISTFIERGKTFDLILTASKSTSENVANAYVYAFADWDRDGTFETSLGEKTLSDIAHKDFSGEKINVSVPDAAEIGKTRIRVLLKTEKVESVSPESSQYKTFIYDFVVFVKEKTDKNDDVSVFVSSSNSELGTAIISETPNENGKFKKGSSITIKAIKNTEEGKIISFVGWSDGIDIVSKEETYTFDANTSTYLIALFSVPKATLEAPVASTADEPIWYQIKNAQTDSRLDRYLAHTEEIPTGYSTALRIEKPVSFEAHFLWRLEKSNSDMVRIVNKETQKEIYSANGSLNTTLYAKEEGSDFFIAPSGHSNGSYSIKWNNDSKKLLNGGLPFNVVLYNAGVGTGSGWYFYRVPAELSNVDLVEIFPYQVFSFKNKIFIQNLEKNDIVSIYDSLGRKLFTEKAKTTEISYSISQKGMYIITVKQKNSKLFSQKICS